MNYYMPYFNMYPNAISNVAPAVASSASKGIFSRLLGGLNWASILNNTQKTLSLVNQAIPVIKQVSPVMKNAKTMFRVMNEFKRIDSPVSTDEIKVGSQNSTRINQPTRVNNYSDNTKTVNFDGCPTFFVN